MIKKINRSILLVSFITLISCFVIITGIFYEYFEGQLKSELENEAYLAARGVEQLGITYFDGLDADSRLTWVDGQGDVLYDSFSAEHLENHLNREEIQMAFETGSGYSQRFSDTISKKTVNYALLLSDGTVLRVSSSQYTVWVILASMLQPAAALILVILILAVSLAVALSKKIVKPINDIDLENPSVDENYEELAPLIGRIDRQNRLIKRQMADLKSRQKEFLAITENMSEGFVLIDSQYHLLSYNSSAMRVLGLKDGDNFSLEHTKGFSEIVKEGMTGKHIEQKLSWNNRVYQVLANPVYNDKEVNGLVIVILDITEKEQQELMRREFTSNVSHELKTPLTTIYGVSEMIMNGIVKPEDISKFAGNIHDESGRLIDLVNDIIRLSQLDENDISQQKEPVDLYSAAADAAQQLRTVAAASGIAITVFGEKAVVNGIPAIINEMIYNICDNAVKYNRENGRVDITVGSQEGHPFITVKDTGIGIPPEHIDRVFERFYRVDKSHSRRNGGTGLGLSIVKHGAAYHNAKIQMESKVGEGTCITLTF